MAAKPNNSTAKKPAAQTKEQRRAAAKARAKTLSGMPAAKRLAIKIRSAADRLEKLTGKAARFDPGIVPGSVVPSQSLKRACEEVRSALSSLDAIPDTFKAKGSNGGSGETAITVGATVRLREKRAAQYMDDLSLAEQANLKVVEIRKSKVVCQTLGGVRVWIPRAHVRLADPQPTAAPAAAAPTAAAPAA